MLANQRIHDKDLRTGHDKPLPLTRIFPTSSSNIILIYTHFVNFEYFPTVIMPPFRRPHLSHRLVLVASGGVTFRGPPDLLLLRFVFINLLPPPLCPGLRNQHALVAMRTPVSPWSIARVPSTMLV